MISGLALEVYGEDVISGALALEVRLSIGGVVVYSTT